eukprot:gb/GEZN01004049.1/.p1 GENE.gb/GEZN01004049.1/~~gb/GEZN01004049.1/.p1  ORF type:complete len:616 (+),score=60.91 gb/GEZN01004049.1/:98-1945(+)
MTARKSKFNRWSGLAGAVYLELLSGLMALFPFYSGDLKRILGADQTLLSWCSTAGAIGGNLAFVSGFFYDRFGGRITGMVGTVFQTCAFGSIYLVTTGTLPRLPLFVAALCGLANFGAVFQDTAAIASCITVFPFDKGLVSGMVGTMFGLCSSMMVVLTVGLLGHSGSEGQVSSQASCQGNVYIGGAAAAQTLLNTTIAPSISSSKSTFDPSQGLNLMLFVALLNCGLGFCATMFLPYGRPRDLLASITFAQINLRLSDKQRSVLHMGYGIVTLIVLFLGLSSLLNAAWSTHGAIPHKAHLTFATILLCFFFFPFLIAHYGADPSGPIIITHSEPPQKDGKGVDMTPLLTDAAATEDPKDSSEDTTGDNTRESSVNDDMGNYCIHDYTVCEAIQTIDFWLIVLAGMGGSGAAAMTNTQLAQITLAVGLSPFQSGILIILAGLANGFTQLITGFAQEPLLRRGFTRPFLCFICVAIAAAAQFIMAFSAVVSGALETGLFLTMMMPGAIWSLLGPATADVLGNSHIGVLYATVAIGCTPAIIFLNQGVAGPLYDAQYLAGPANDTKTCCGRLCFQTAHFVTAGVTGVISLAPLLLYYRTREWYFRQYYTVASESSVS